MAARQKKAMAMVSWISSELQYTTAEAPKTLDDLKTGVALLQLAHSIDCRAFDLARVDFYASTKYHYEKNWKLFQEVLERMEISRDFIIERLCEGEKQRDLYMLMAYFHLHFETLVDQRRPTRKEIEKAPPEQRKEMESKLIKYDPIAERKRAMEIRRLRTRPSCKRRSVSDMLELQSVSESSQVSAFSTYSTRGMMKKVRFKTAIASWMTELPSCPTPNSARSVDGALGGSGSSAATLALAGASPLSGKNSSNNSSHASSPMAENSTTTNVGTAALGRRDSLGHLGSVINPPQAPATEAEGATFASAPAPGVGGVSPQTPVAPGAVMTDTLQSNNAGFLNSNRNTSSGPSFTSTFTGSVTNLSAEFSPIPTSCSSGGTSVIHHLAASDQSLVRDVMLMEAVPCEVLKSGSTNFWQFNGWPASLRTTQPVLDVDGDRVHSTFTFEAVKAAAKARATVTAAVAATTTNTTVAGGGTVTDACPNRASGSDDAEGDPVRRLSYGSTSELHLSGPPPPASSSAAAPAAAAPPQSTAVTASTLRSTGHRPQPTAMVIPVGGNTATTSSMTTTAAAGLRTLDTNPWEDFDACMADDDDDAEEAKKTQVVGGDS